MNTLAAPQQELVREAARSLLDPQGRALAAQVEWWHLPGLGPSDGGSWPVAVLGEGPPVLLLHGFDSSFLEFRRLAPLLAASGAQLFIPDLFGFGFCPRPAAADYGPSGVLRTWSFLCGQLASATQLPWA